MQRGFFADTRQIIWRKYDKQFGYRQIYPSLSLWPTAAGLLFDANRRALRRRCMFSHRVRIMVQRLTAGSL